MILPPLVFPADTVNTKPKLNRQGGHTHGATLFINDSQNSGTKQFMYHDVMFTVSSQVCY